MALYRQTLWAFYHVMFRTCAEYPGIAIVLTFPVKSKKLCAEPKLAQHGTEICNNARVCAYAYESAFVFGCHGLRVRKLGCSVYVILLKQIIKVKHENRTYFINQNSLEQNINEELNKISGWLKVNKLSLNAKKSKFMIFKRVNKTVEHLSLKIENTNIERVTNFHFLGLTISDNLEWKTHVQKIANKCSRTTGILNKLKHILPAGISLMLYNSLLLPQLNYCILAWGHNCKRLIKLQKKALRIISISKYNAHTDPLFKIYRILKLPHILQLQELKFYHKYINKKLPAYLQSIPLKQNKSFHEHLTRSHLKLHITRTNHRFAERCIRNSIPLLVDTMPMEIINKISTHSLQNVARRIKEYYLSSYKERCDILNCYVCQI